VPSSCVVVSFFILSSDLQLQTAWFPRYSICALSLLSVLLEIEQVVNKLGTLLGSVGHRVKIHKMTSVTGKERGDIEIKDYVVVQTPQEQTNRLPPPRTLILALTMTHTRYGRSMLTLLDNVLTLDVQINTFQKYRKSHPVSSHKPRQRGNTDISSKRLIAGLKQHVSRRCWRLLLWVSAYSVRVSAYLGTTIYVFSCYYYTYVLKKFNQQ
jgi:hypothetical protein